MSTHVTEDTQAAEALRLYRAERYGEHPPGQRPPIAAADHYIQARATRIKRVDGIGPCYLFPDGSRLPLRKVGEHLPQA